MAGQECAKVGVATGRGGMLVCGREGWQKREVKTEVRELPPTPPLQVLLIHTSLD